MKTQLPIRKHIKRYRIKPNPLALEKVLKIIAAGGGFLGAGLVEKTARDVTQNVINDIRESYTGRAAAWWGGDITKISPKFVSYPVAILGLSLGSKLIPKDYKIWFLLGSGLKLLYNLFAKESGTSPTPPPPNIVDVPLAEVAAQATKIYQATREEYIAKGIWKFYDPQGFYTYMKARYPISLTQFDYISSFPDVEKSSRQIAEVFLRSYPTLTAEKILLEYHNFLGRALATNQAQEAVAAGYLPM